MFAKTALIFSVLAALGAAAPIARPELPVNVFLASNGTVEAANATSAGAYYNGNATVAQNGTIFSFPNNTVLAENITEVSNQTYKILEVQNGTTFQNASVINGSVLDGLVLVAQEQVTTTIEAVHYKPTHSAASTEEAVAASSTEEAAAPSSTSEAAATKEAQSSSAEAQKPAPTSESSTQEAQPTTTSSTQEAKPTQGGSSSTGGSFTGDATFYATGLGACGGTNSDSDYIVALNVAQWNQFGTMSNGNPVCGKKVQINGPAGSATATVTDQCPGCAFGDLDMSPAVFKATVGDEGIGRAKISWSWA